MLITKKKGESNQTRGIHDPFPFFFFSLQVSCVLISKPKIFFVPWSTSVMDEWKETQLVMSNVISAEQKRENYTRQPEMVSNHMAGFILTGLALFASIELPKLRWVPSL